MRAAARKVHISMVTKLEDDPTCCVFPQIFKQDPPLDSHRHSRRAMEQRSIMEMLVGPYTRKLSNLGSHGISLLLGHPSKATHHQRAGKGCGWLVGGQQEGVEGPPFGYHILFTKECI